jgi:hypothetical protein
MSRTRLILLALLAVFAVSAVVLPSALAEPKKCSTGSTHWVFCYNNNEEMSLQKAEGSGGKAILASTLGGEAKFECETSTLVAELEASGKGKGTITLHKCKETKPEHCRLTEAEEKELELPFAESLTSEYKKGVLPEAAFAGTGSSEEIYDLTIEEESSACAIPTGSYKITGKQETELPNAEESLAEHEFVAKKSLSDMKVGSNPASLSATDKVKLSSSHDGSSAWYVGLGT